METDCCCCLIGFDSCGNVIVGCSKTGLKRCTILPFALDGTKDSSSPRVVLASDKRGFGCGLISFLMRRNKNKNIHEIACSARYSYLVGSIAVNISALLGCVSRYIVDGAPNVVGIDVD